jgi:hypothetical protein
LAEPTAEVKNLYVALVGQVYHPHASAGRVRVQQKRVCPLLAYGCYIADVAIRKEENQRVKQSR